MRAALIVDGQLVDDPYIPLTGNGPPPEGDGAVIASFEQWRAYRGRLAGRPRLGLRLLSDESPDLIADDLGHFSLIVLEFPHFKDGRAYSYGRLLRERYAFEGELRAAGDVLRDQLHFMLRAGFNAFELCDPDPLEALGRARQLQSVWYQPSGDGHLTALELRARARATAGS